MSPGFDRQIALNEVGRSDVFDFGRVLYEIITRENYDLRSRDRQNQWVVEEKLNQMQDQLLTNFVIACLKPDSKYQVDELLQHDFLKDLDQDYLQSPGK